MPIRCPRQEGVHGGQQVGLAGVQQAGEDVEDARQKGGEELKGWRGGKCGGRGGSDCGRSECCHPLVQRERSSPVPFLRLPSGFVAAASAAFADGAGVEVGVEAKEVAVAPALLLVGDEGGGG